MDLIFLSLQSNRCQAVVTADNVILPNEQQSCRMTRPANPVITEVQRPHGACVSQSKLSALCSTIIFVSLSACSSRFASARTQGRERAAWNRPQAQQHRDCQMLSEAEPDHSVERAAFSRAQNVDHGSWDTGSCSAPHSF